jgi:hypothetical protein
MSNNPLQKYFRQPKVFIKLPSGGIFSKPGTIQGDVTHLPVYGMTGMDEIINKTPDALLTGESTAAIITSCCPTIKDPWEICNIDLPMIMAAIRVATYGNLMSVTHTCTNCGTENDYDLDLNRVIEHYMNCQYDNKIVLDDLVINLLPMNYRLSTEFNLKNFRLQQQVAQAEVVTDDAKRQELISELFKELARVQNEIYKVTIESVTTENQVVTERAFILEWIENADRSVFEAIKKKNQQNTDTWSMPKYPVKCDECGTEVSLSVELDQANFFVKA